MKHHIISAAILLVAMLLYFAGYSGAGIIGFIAGAVFEIWFWFRILF